MFVILLKEKLRKVIKYLGIDFTKNLKYDRLTEKVIKQSIKEGQVGIDIGCHKGEILDIFIDCAPNTAHYGFEPIPDLYESLKNKYGKHHHIFPFALSNKSGKSIFYHVKNAPAYSGIKQRKYDISKPKIDEIDVEVRILDEIIPIDSDIKFIKIDVEGGEMGVLEGSIKTIQRCQPIILFEFGMGASDIYGTKPSDIFDYFENLDYKIYCLSSYLEKKEFLDFDSFDNLYNKGIEYYFVATLS